MDRSGISPTPQMVDQGDLYPQISTIHSPLDPYISAYLIGGRGLIEKHIILVKSHPFFAKALASLLPHRLIETEPLRIKVALL
jgi:hypothetical protein